MFLICVVGVSSRIESVSVSGTWYFDENVSGKIEKRGNFFLEEKKREKPARNTTTTHQGSLSVQLSLFIE